MAPCFLESFDVPSAPEAAPPRMGPDTDVAAAREEGHAAGYEAGWAAAMAGGDRHQARIRGAFAASLQDLSFTYHEARAHVLRGLEPLLRELLQGFLPALMNEALGHTVMEELRPLAEAAADLPVQVTVAPDDAPSLR